MEYGLRIIWIRCNLLIKSFCWAHVQKTLSYQLSTMTMYEFYHLTSEISSSSNYVVAVKYWLGLTWFVSYLWWSSSHIPRDEGFSHSPCQYHAAFATFPDVCPFHTPTQPSDIAKYPLLLPFDQHWIFKSTVLDLIFMSNIACDLCIPSTCLIWKA